MSELQRRDTSAPKSKQWFGHQSQQAERLVANLKRIATAVKDGTHTRIERRTVCERCRYWRTQYHGDVSGKSVCKECWQDLGEPTGQGSPTKEATSEITNHRMPDMGNGPYSVAEIVAPTGALLVTERPSPKISVFVIRNGVVQLCPEKYVADWRDKPAKDVKAWALAKGWVLRWVPYAHDPVYDDLKVEPDLWARKHNPDLR